MAGKLIVSIGYTIADNGGHDHHEVDLIQTPHILVGGTTGSGKSTFIHSLLIQILLKYNKKVLIYISNPKVLDFCDYSYAPNTTVANTQYDTYQMLMGISEEMDRRFLLLQKQGLKSALSSPFMKNILLVMDEIYPSDDKYGKKIMDMIVRLVRLGRSCGITCVLATQYPTASILSPQIKMCCPTRVCFHVCSSVNSRVVLDENGGEHLSGHGDMLVRFPFWNGIRRMNGLYYKPHPEVSCSVIGRARDAANGIFY